LKDAVGSELVSNFIAVKREELRILDGKSTEDQIAYYLHYV
jgi:glutamine synthetase